MKDHLNRRIKHRESFRPFAPSVLEERAGDWFERRSVAVHADDVSGAPRANRRTCRRSPTWTAPRDSRPSAGTNPKYWALIHAFERKTGVPVVLNTSFNENEPVVNTPEEGDLLLSAERHGRAGARAVPRREISSPEATSRSLRTFAVTDSPDESDLEETLGRCGRGAFSIARITRTSAPPASFSPSSARISSRGSATTSRSSPACRCPLKQPIAPVHWYAPVRREERHGVHILRAWGTVAADADVHGTPVELSELLFVGGRGVVPPRTTRCDRLADRSADRVADGHRGGAARPARSSCFSVRTCFLRWRACSEDFQNDKVEALLTRIGRFTVQTRRSDHRARRHDETPADRDEGRRPGRSASFTTGRTPRRIRPGPKDNAFAREHGLVDKFVVMHSGNVAVAGCRRPARRRRASSGSARRGHRDRRRGIRKRSLQEAARRGPDATSASSRISRNRSSPIRLLRPTSSSCR